MITSKSNELIKHIKSLQQKKYRDEYNEFFVEGVKLVKEAIQEKAPICNVIICDELLSDKINCDGLNVEYVNESVFNFISDTQTPQGILAVIRFEQETKELGDFVFALDDIQDPGNLGTIIRTLDCAGIDSLITSKNTVDVYNPKVIRSTMGAIYRINVIDNVELKNELLKLKNQGYKIVITDLQATKYHYDLNYNEKLVIVIGNESNGVSDDIKAIANEKIKIPMLGRTESLNAGVASSIVAYEFVRNKMSNKRMENG